MWQCREYVVEIVLRPYTAPVGYKFAFDDAPIYNDRRVPGLFLQLNGFELSNHIRNHATIADSFAVTQGCCMVAAAGSSAVVEDCMVAAAGSSVAVEGCMVVAAGSSVVAEDCMVAAGVAYIVDIAESGALLDRQSDK